MAYETILYDLDGPVLTITLNRPEKMNAYTGVMGAELADAFHRADEDDTVRVVIVTGAGRGFCAGADISGGANAFDTKAEGSVAFAAPGQPRQQGGGFVGAIFGCRKPVIGKVPASTTVDMVFGINRDAWRVEAYVKNLFDDDGQNDRFVQCAASVCSRVYTIPIRPRTAGLRFGQSF